MTAQPSGVDLARVALQNARAAAKNAPTVKAPRQRTSVADRVRGGRDPMAFGDALMRMVAERGWESGVAAGGILDQWPTIAPELVGKVAAEKSGGIDRHLRSAPGVHAYATQLRLHHRQVLTRIQATPGGAAVKAVTTLPVAARSVPDHVQADTTASAAAAPAPVPIPARDKSAGYRRALAAHRATCANIPQPESAQQVGRTA
ncbi:hypothetical protein [Streptomyces sp. NPDC058745]|uniref:hypothetical protein n=1 Tax=Streptomyces sp. NPDC058745 TaxID=3346621 RepID=UPI003683E369